MTRNGINLGHIPASSEEKACQLLVAAGGLGKRGVVARAGSEGKCAGIG